MNKVESLIRQLRVARVTTRLWTMVAAFASATGCSAPGPITVGDNVQVSMDLPTVVHWEVVTCVDPSGARRLLTIGLIDGGVTQTIFQTDGVAYLSTDGGQRWETSLDLRGKAARTIDPDCVFGSDGTAYLSMMYAADADAPWDELALYRSTDGGRTWLPPVIAPMSLGIDRPFVAIDNTGGQYDGHVYVNGLVRGQGRPRALTLFRSVNGGVSLEPPVRLVMPDATYFISPGGITVLSDGTVVSLFYETKAWCLAENGSRVACSQRSPRYVKAYTSTDGGETITPPVTIATTSIQPRPISLAVDRGNGPFRDRLYAMWADSSGVHKRVVLAYSDDKGSSWSTPTTVSDNIRWSPPDLGPDVFLPALAVNRAGVVGVLWYDERGNPGREHLLQLGYDVRFAASLDGGETFLPSVRVTSQSVTEHRSSGEWLAASLIPASAEWGTTALSVSLKSHSLGHTAGLESDSSGVFHAVWVDGRTGVGQIWTAPVTVVGTAVRNGSPEFASLVDITGNATLDVSRIWYNRARHTVSAEVRLRNTGRDAIEGPVYVRLLTLSGGIGRVTASNSDNGIDGAGASWDFTSALPDGVLSPGQVSAPITFRFVISELRQGAPNVAGFVGNLVHFNVRVLGMRPDAP